jgi:hypothetical protein
LFTVDPPVDTLDLGLPWATLVVTLLVQLVVLGLAAWLVGRAVAARSGLTRLRESL